MPATPSRSRDVESHLQGRAALEGPGAGIVIRRLEHARQQAIERYLSAQTLQVNAVA
ncbi:MAG: hypothetical protein R2752_00890 [Vicinamibacterales bacterium]